MPNVAVLVDWHKRWNRSLRQFLGRRVRSTVDIEDLAQETYLRLLRAPDLLAVRNPQAYLLRVASHVAAEWRRGQMPTSALEINEEAIIDECLPELDLEETAAQERLNQVLAQMSPRMCAVVLLRLRDEQSCKEIAHQLDLTLRQVRRDLARGSQSLRAALKK